MPDKKAKSDAEKRVNLLQTMEKGLEEVADEVKEEKDSIMKIQ